MDALIDNDCKINLDEKNWSLALDLIQKLIKCHPVYASEGLDRAQEHIFSYMKSQCWDNINDYHYTAQEILDEEEYVNVNAFGPHYANYHTFSKRNIIGIIDGYTTGPTLILNGHVDIDVVSSRDSWSQREGWKLGEIIDGRLIGRGACDMLSGLVSLITVANILHHHRHMWKGRIILTSVVDEEIGGNGTLHALKWLKEKGYLEVGAECLIAEPSNRKICTESLGFMHLQLHFKRPPVHMGVATKQNSALWDMHKLIGEFGNILLEAGRIINPSICEKQLLFNFGIVNGGIDSAIPISELHLEGTIFLPDGLLAEELIKALKEVIERKQIPVEMQLGSFGFKGASFLPGKLYDALNSPPYSSDIFPSPCDARLFKRYQIPTIIFGPGFLEQAHATDEFIELAEVKSYIKHVLNSALAYLGQ